MNTEELEEKKERLQQKIIEVKDYNWTIKLEKKDKIIKEMAKHITYYSNIDETICKNIKKCIADDEYTNCEKCIIDYFEKVVKGQEYEKKYNVNYRGMDKIAEEICREE